MIELTIINNTGNTVEFGSRLFLETLVKDQWYNIDSMINDNINLAWNDMLYLLDHDKSLEDNFYIKYYQPLLEDRYRLIKEVSADDKVAYVSYEFDIK